MTMPPTVMGRTHNHATSLVPFFHHTAFQLPLLFLDDTFPSYRRLVQTAFACFISAALGYKQQGQLSARR